MPKNKIFNEYYYNNKTEHTYSMRYLLNFFFDVIILNRYSCENDIKKTILMNENNDFIIDRDLIIFYKKIRKIYYKKINKRKI